MDEDMLRAIMQEAFVMGRQLGEARAIITELHANMTALEEKLENQKTENAALVRKIEKLRGAEVTD